MDDDKIVQFPTDYVPSAEDPQRIRDAIADLTEEVRELSKLIGSLVRALKQTRK